MKLQTKYILKTKEQMDNNIYSKIQSIRIKIENHKFNSVYQKLKELNFKPTIENYIKILKELQKEQEVSYMWYVYFLKKYFSKNKLWK